MSFETWRSWWTSNLWAGWEEWLFDSQRSWATRVRRANCNFWHELLQNVVYVPPATKRGVLVNFTRSCRRIDGTLISLSVHRFSCFRGKFGLQNELGKLSHAASNSSNCTSRVSGLICFSQLVYISRYCLFARTTFRDEGYYVNASFTRQMGRKKQGSSPLFPHHFQKQLFVFVHHPSRAGRQEGFLPFPMPLPWERKQLWRAGSFVKTATTSLSSTGHPAAADARLPVTCERLSWWISVDPSFHAEFATFQL